MEIEDNKSIGESQKTQKNTRAASGRKPEYESRATEFRQALIVWKQTPESLRPSLHALAGELGAGATHQMLSYYLNNGLERWQAKENAKRIRARAEAEGRGMTMRECFDAILLPGLLGQIEKLRQEAKRGPLNRHQTKMLKLFAQRGYPGARELLQKCSQNGSGDKTPKDYREDFESVWARLLASPHSPSESEKPRLARRYERWRASLEAQHSQGAPHDH